ncbi:HAMP domain-containing histidine kinase [Dissulfurirhabdus thermomarina]|uniref:histidine kinase n=1 Tax=Dissulfurirhabdus thermomarina TaxID=1765737 RepID=A0A6N9TNV6_DISTH|nr:HAMP domain-containing sensor histidine kinase [Dissulfurirhabdus thermomarina]NDY42971.1 HAMP domain-containing histidine kinase [Dissulfurirhabdus thermomarina]NMX23950.1 HAMP domain-containing histidine kinase [Dissulfurirhabdus thermomarina]
MGPETFFAVTVLFLLWLLTGAGLVLCWRRLRRRSGIEGCPPVDLLAQIAARQREEARTAAARLFEVADSLGFGLILAEEGRPAASNALAERLCPVEYRGPEGARRLVAALGPEGSRILREGGRTLQARRRTLAGAAEAVLLEDVTETFRLAEQLRRSERLALLGQMSGQVAHQLKTPLAVLAGRAQLLSARLEKLPALQDQAEEIYREAAALARRINEIVDFYRHREPGWHRVSLEEVLGAVAERLAPVAGAVAVEARCETDPEVETDPVLLENLLFLLGQNAVAEEVGATRVEIRAVDQPGGRVGIRVRDDGRGVAPEVRERLFEPFSGTRDDGLGLGLFLARDLAERLGGELALEAAGPGASFLLTVPRSRPDGAGAPPRPG